MPEILRVLSLSIALTVLCFFPPPAFASDSLTLEEHTYLTEEYYPFNYCEGETIAGISADLLRLVWQDLGIEHASIHQMPWARAYDRILHTPGTVLFSMARTDEREHSFKWAGPIMVARFVLISEKHHNITIQSLDQLKGLSIGTLRDDIADTLLRPYKNIANIQPVADMALNVAKLRDNRLNLIAYDELSWHMLAKRMHLDLAEFQTVYVLKETAVHYAFNPAISDAELERFQNALDRIKSSPVYGQMLGKYLH